MLRTVTALVLALLATVAVASAAVLATSKQALHQPLGITLTGQGSRVERLDDYAPSQPIAVRVDAPQARGVTLLGLGPDGGNVRVPLARGADGRFSADVTLTTPGVWSLAVASGAETSESFAISVAQGVSHAALGVAFGLAVLSLGGGIALIWLGLRRARRTVPSAG